MALSEFFPKLLGKKQREQETQALVLATQALQTAKTDLDKTRKDLQRTRRAVRSEYKTEVLRGRADPSIVRGVERIPFRTLRRIYRKSSTVRACVDTIVREIANLPWCIRAKEGFSPNKEHIGFVTEFFKNPNYDQESFRQLLTKVLIDLLVLDAGVIEKVWSLDGSNLLEIVARNGAEFVPMVDNRGYLLGYEQRTETMIDTPVTFFPKDIVYMMLYPQSDSIFGQPIIDSITDEVATLLYAVDFVGKSFTEDEIPPGILNLGMIGKEAYERFLRAIKEERGGRKERTLRTVFGTPDIKWVEFRRPNREMQTAELMARIERIIYRNFGITPVQMGVTEKVPRASAEVQLEVSESKMISPIVNLLNFYINQDIVSFFGFDDIEFALCLPEEKQEESDSRSAKNYVSSAIATIDEVRKRYLKLEPLPNGLGSRPFVLSGGNLIFLDDPSPVPEEPALEEDIFEGQVIEEESEILEAETEILEEAEVKKKHIPLEDLDELVEKYETLLKDKWDNVKKEMMAKVGDKKLSSTSIKTMANLLFLRLKNASRKTFPKALDMGILHAEDVLNERGIVTKQERDNLLRESYKTNEKYLKENLVKDLQVKLSDIKKVIKKQEEEEEDFVPLVEPLPEEEDDDFIPVLIEHVEKAFAGLVFRLASYAGALNGVAHEGFSEVMLKRGQMVYWIDRGDNKECVDCIDMRKNSPYKSKKQMKFLPGWGVRCGGRCRCFLSTDDIV